MAYKVVELAAVFFIALTLTGNMLFVTGITEQLGISGGPPSSSEALGDATGSAEDVTTGAPTGSTLFGAYNVLVGQISTVLGIINPSLKIFYNLGVPGYLVGGGGNIGLLPPIFTVLKGLAIMEFFRGFSG